MWTLFMSGGVTVWAARPPGERTARAAQAGIRAIGISDVVRMAVSPASMREDESKRLISSEAGGVGSNCMVIPLVGEVVSKGRAPKPRPDFVAVSPVS
jgi:hypothetical protein